LADTTGSAEAGKKASARRDKAPARWAVLVGSGLASAGLLWAVVNAPIASQPAAGQPAEPPPTTAPASLTTASVARGFENDDGDHSERESRRAVSSPRQAPSAGQTAPTTGRFRTRGS
jgi:hypothetical protein